MKVSPVGRPPSVVDGVPRPPNCYLLPLVRPPLPIFQFGQLLKSEMNPEWVDSYLDYDKLKVMIDELVNAHVGIVMDTGKGASLSVARPTNAAGLPENQSTQEQFFSFIEQEIRKIDLFTKRMVRDIRQVLTDCESEANALASLPAGEARETATALLRAKMEACGEDFLKVRRFGSPLSPPPSPANLSVPPFSSLSSSQLEKYVNLNFTGFHKILKKHDRHLPNPCKAFYTARLHDQVSSPFHAAFSPPSLAATVSHAHARRPLHLAHDPSSRCRARASSCRPVVLSSPSGLPVSSPAVSRGSVVTIPT